MKFWNIGLLALLFILGCSGGSSGTDAGSGRAAMCVPGMSIACVGVGGCSGGQVCNSAGSGYGPCNCGMSWGDGSTRELVDGGNIYVDGSVGTVDGSTEFNDADTIYVDGGIIHVDGGNIYVDGGIRLIDGGPTPDTGEHPDAMSEDAGSVLDVGLSDIGSALDVGASVPDVGPSDTGLVPDVGPSDTGLVAQATIVVQPMRITFSQTGALPPSQTKVRIFSCGTRDLILGHISLRNISGLTQAFSLVNLPANGTVISPQNCISDPAGAEFDVVFSPGSNGNYTAEATVNSNDPTRPVLTISISGQRS